MWQQEQDAVDQHLAVCASRTRMRALVRVLSALRSLDCVRMVRSAHSSKPARAHTRTRTHTHAHGGGICRLSVHTHTHTHTPTHTHTRTHTHTHAHTHTHTHTRLTPSSAGALRTQCDCRRCSRETQMDVGTKLDPKCKSTRCQSTRVTNRSAGGGSAGSRPQAPAFSHEMHPRMDVPRRLQLGGGEGGSVCFL